MFSLGITGIICSGKTQFSRLLKTMTAAGYFNADDYIRECLENDPEVAQEIRNVFGDDVLTESGKPDRARLRDIIFQDEGKRKSLESILHPRVWKACQNRIEESSSLLVADIPLIYETQSQNRFQAVLVVASSSEVQTKRLIENRNISADMAQKMILSQLSQTQKMLLADYLVWNDGSPETLKIQAELFAENLPNG
ncbi:MAG: dephospho-CoA kinase [Chthoniobacterales bacterium]